MFYITNSIWTSMLMHFVNNGATVVVYYLCNIGVIEDAEHFGETQNAWIIIASAVITIAVIAWSWIKAKPKQPLMATYITPHEEND